jgi:Uma2 family endonuclease
MTEPLIATATPASRTEAHRRRATYDEYLALASESRIVEWVDGEMIEYMPPSIEHQDLTGYLFQFVASFVREYDLGKVVIAPAEVKLWPGGPSREPDVFFVRTDQMAGFDRWRYSGAPDLVVEVVSPGSVREDRVRKFSEYEQAGVPEYWLVDPRPHQRTVECYRRDDAGIYQPVEPDDGGRIYSSVLTQGDRHFWLHVDWPWQEPLPKVQALLGLLTERGE